MKKFLISALLGVGVSLAGFNAVAINACNIACVRAPCEPLCKCLFKRCMAAGGGKRCYVEYQACMAVPDSDS